MSLRRLISSRANAKRSTGPRTIAGKHRSAQNALRHGCRSRTLVIPDGHARQDFDNLLQSYLSRLEPRNPAERACIDQMAAAKWRQRCLTATENRMLNEAIASQPSPLADAGTPHRIADAIIGLLTVPGLAVLSRYEVTEDHKYYRALGNLLNLKKQVPQKPGSLTNNSGPFQPQLNHDGAATPPRLEEQPATVQQPATRQVSPSTQRAAENKICTNEATLGFLYASDASRQTRNLPARSRGGFSRLVGEGSPSGGRQPNRDAGQAL